MTSNGWGAVWSGGGVDVLVIGGSVFVGRAVVNRALAAGHRVTVFNRGRSGRVPPEVEVIVGDRTVPAELGRLAGRQFDLVIDTCGYVPVDVAAAAEVLAPTVGHYAFVSTISVFPGWPADVDYHATPAHSAPADARAEQAPGENAYGWLKSGCERAVLEHFSPDRTSILRAGCIVGPDDSRTGRLPWWLDRFARPDTPVLVPGDPQDPVVLIDARDLADFALTTAPGTFEVTGPAMTRTELMRDCANATGSPAELVWVDSTWLTQRDVAAWTDVPLWAPPDSAPSLFAHDNSAAVAAGLRHRLMMQTVADTWQWQQQLPGGWRPTEATPGLAPAKELALLREWLSRND